MEIGTGGISGGLGEEDRGERDDDSQLGEWEDQTNEEELMVI